MSTTSSHSFAGPRLRQPKPDRDSEAAQVAAQLLRAKLAYVLARVGQVFNGVHANIALLQVWMPDGGACVAPKDALQADYHADSELTVMADACFDGFRSASAQCHDCGRLSMPGRVFRSGCIQVVQNLRVLPACLHPRSRLSDALAERVGAALYLPVYDLARPEGGPAAVLEALLARGAPDSMLVANLMSFMGSQLSALQLSLSSPLPQPVLPSALAGRRPRPPVDLTDSDDEEEDVEEAPIQAWAARRPAAKRAAPQHPAMLPPRGGAACAEAAQSACDASCGAAPALTCSADSTCTVVTDVTSCGAFPAAAAAAASAALRAPAPKRAATALLTRPAATAPPELCHDDDDDCDCGIGSPRSKRLRFGSAVALAMRRTQSVPRSLADLLGGSQPAPAPAVAPCREEY